MASEVSHRTFSPGQDHAYYYKGKAAAYEHARDLLAQHREVCGPDSAELVALEQALQDLLDQARVDQQEEEEEEDEE